MILQKKNKLKKKNSYTFISIDNEQKIYNN